MRTRDMPANKIENDIVVKKFGGTSVDDLEAVQAIVENNEEGAQPIAVVSAFSGQTDALFAIADRFLKNPSIDGSALAEAIFTTVITPLITSNRIREESHRNALALVAEPLIAQSVREIRTLAEELNTATTEEKQNEARIKITDCFIGIGEILSSQVLASIFTIRSQIEKVYEAVDLTNVFEGNDTILEGAPLYELLQKKIGEAVSEVLERGNTPIVPGYIRLPGGIANIIDRGYTDTTAALTAVGLSQRKKTKNVEERHHVTLEIWKEVPGLLSGDPRIIEPKYKERKPRKRADFVRTKLRPEVSMNEAAELTGFGTMKAVNPFAIDVLSTAMSNGHERLDFFVRNTFEPDLPGTQITLDGPKDDSGIRFIAGRKGLSVITVRNPSLASKKGWDAALCIACRDNDVSIINTTGGSVTTTSFSIESDSVGRTGAINDLRTLGTVSERDEMAIVCCIGKGMRKSIGILAETTGVLAKAGINIEYDSGEADSNISLVISETDLPKAIDVLHKHFIEKKKSPWSQLVGAAKKTFLSLFGRNSK